MYRCILWNKNGDIIEIGDEQLVEKWQQDQDTFIWLDASDNDAEKEKTFLHDVFSVNPYAISDAQRNRHPPKIEIFTNSEIILLKELRETVSGSLADTIQLALISSSRYLITRCNGASHVINSYWSTIQINKKQKMASPRKIVLELSQSVSDNYTQRLLTTEERLDAIEDKMFRSPNDLLLSTLINYQTQLRKVRRVLLYHRQIFAHKNFRHYEIDDQVDELLRNNVYEHTERSHSLALLYYELTSDLIDGHISISSHRLNQIMKVLTIITVIFVPLSFLAGIYGMNFENIPELKSRYGYFILIGIMFSIASLLLYLFKYKKWL